MNPQERSKYEKCRCCEVLAVCPAIIVPQQQPLPSIPHNLSFEIHPLVAFPIVQPPKLYSKKPCNVLPPYNLRKQQHLQLKTNPMPKISVVKVNPVAPLLAFAQVNQNWQRQLVRKEQRKNAASKDVQAMILTRASSFIESNRFLKHLQKTRYHQHGQLTHSNRRNGKLS